MVNVCTSINSLCQILKHMKDTCFCIDGLLSLDRGDSEAANRAVNPPHLQILRNDKEGLIDDVIMNET